MLILMLVEGYCGPTGPTAHLKTAKPSRSKQILNCKLSAYSHTVLVQQGYLFENKDIKWGTFLCFLLKLHIQKLFCLKHTFRSYSVLFSCSDLLDILFSVGHNLDYSLHSLP